jgi:flagellar M-ring protein FliF
MGDKAKAFLEKVKEFVKKHVKALIAALVVVVALVAGVLIWSGTRPYEVLFTELNSTEMASILSYMEELGVTDYKVEDADTILVKESQVNGLKVRLLMEGYPQTGFAYTYTQSSGMLSTESERAQAALQDLQNRRSEGEKRRGVHARRSAAYGVPGRILHRLHTVSTGSLSGHLAGHL